MDIVQTNLQQEISLVLKSKVKKINAVRSLSERSNINAPKRDGICNPALFPEAVRPNTRSQRKRNSLTQWRNYTI